MILPPWILVTGFGPFRTVIENPSWSAVSQLPTTLTTERNAPISLLKLKLNVDYRELDEFYECQLPKHVEEMGQRLPLLVVHVGVNGKEKKVQLERRAFNACEGADVRGFVPPSGCVVPSDPVDFEQSNTDISKFFVSFVSKFLS
jgi:pyrrolidone-carboxylate peptidase